MPAISFAPLMYDNGTKVQWFKFIKFLRNLNQPLP